MTEPILTVQDLQVAYGQVQAIRDVSFEVMAGSLVTLVGANGAGKSSIINAISGTLRPRGGRITFEGQDITRTPAHRLVRSGLVQVPEGRQVLGTLSVAENLQLSRARRRGADLAEVYDRFPVLARRRNLPAGSLSGGEQQMLALGRALMARPALILLDEPSMGLAPRIVAEVFEVITGIRASGTTVVLVEQNARRALAAADHGYVLASGEIVHQAPAAELLADDRVVQAYLGVET